MTREGIDHVSPRTRSCTAADRRARMQVAEQFWSAAEILEDFVTVQSDPDGINNAYVTVCIHAGIAAADVVCGARTQQWARGESHHEAVKLLRQADSSAATRLKRLLDLKTKAGYDPTLVSGSAARSAATAARYLIDAARELV